MLKTLKHMQKRDWGMVSFSIVFIVTQVYLDLKMPEYMSQITTLVQTPNSAMADIWAAGGMMLLCALGSLAASIIVGYFAARVATNLGATLRERIFGKVLDFSMEETGSFSTSSLITRSTNDITQIQNLVAMGLQLLIKAPILAVWAIVKIAGKQWQWTAVTAGAVVLLMLMLGSIIIFAIPKFKKSQKQTDKLNQVTRENLTGIRVIRAYNAEEYQEGKFEQANNDLTNTNLFVNRIMAIMSPGMSLITLGLTLAIYWVGAFLINAAGTADKLVLFSDMVVFSSYAMQVVMAFTMLTMIFIMLPRASVSAGRINEVLDTTPSITDGKLEKNRNDIKGEVEFKNVSFQYPDSSGASEYVLKDISFTARKGETIAIIGATGSGKSTLVNLIPRFYNVVEGQVLVDGVNVKQYPLEELRNKIGYVSQKAVLFSGTIESNVAYGENGRPSPSAEDVERAVEIAQGTDFVEGLKDTYSSPVAQGGTNLSGGQKQRLSIARAVCRNPEIYIFDDSFSALDYSTDRKLRAALNQELDTATKIIVAQRIGTIRDANSIIVLEDGKIAGMGTHDELMQDCDVYKEIALSQLSKEELNVG